MTIAKLFLVRRITVTVLASALLGLGLSACGGDDAPADYPVAGVQLPDFTQLVERSSPAVVNISTAPERSARSGRPDEDQSPQQGPGSQFEDWFRRFFDNDQGPFSDPDSPNSPHGPGAIPRAALGSGFIISEDGYILTNNHVVGGDSQIIVKLSDRRQLVAELVGRDSYSDIALLKVDAQDLPTVKIGDVSKLKVGSWVVAIGSPFGFETSVTAGIVSAKRRSLAGDQYVPFLQTDVAINPGNSGGPLFNLNGEVVGVNSQIYSRTGGYQGVSFAIPIDVAMGVVKQLRDTGEVSRGWLGVQIQEVNRELAESFGMERPEGALISRVIEDSPAQAAGLAAGDIIVEFNSRAVGSAAGLPPLVGLTPVGETAKLVVLRDGKRKKIEVEIGQLESESSPARERAQQPDKLGLRLSELSGAERDELKLKSGVRIEQVAGGPAARAGLRAGDIIVSAGNKPVNSAKQFRKQIKQAKGPIALLVNRDGNPLFLALDPTP